MADSNPALDESTTAPHYRMTAESLKQDYQQGLITTAGYIYYYIRASRKDGWKLRINNISQFCKELGITRAAFYRAKAHLINNNLLAEEIIGAIDLWIPPNLYALDTTVTQPDTQSRKRDTPSRKRDTQSRKRDIAPPQTQTEQASCNSSDLLQINTDLSQIPPPTQSEREEELIEFVIRQNPGAKRPRAYAIRCLQNDRQHWQGRYEAERNGTAASQDLPPPPAPNRFQIESACIQAHDQGDRPFILAKLQQLWQQGWHDLTEDLCQLYPTWGIAATNSGVVEVKGWLT